MGNVVQRVAANGVARRWWILGLVLLLAASLLALLPTRAPVAQKLGARELSLARDYVFAACIMHRYPNTPLASEADAWAAALVEQGSLKAQDYPALAHWASSAPAPQTTSSGVPMRLQSCVEFVNAKDFPDQLRQTLRRSPGRR